jgi:hypothetical protein
MSEIEPGEGWRLIEKELAQHLCSYDPLNPDNYIAPDPDGWMVVTPARLPGCGCNNCFYGRDKLVLEILRCRNEIKRLREVETRYNKIYKLFCDPSKPIKDKSDERAD